MVTNTKTARVAVAGGKAFQVFEKAESRTAAWDGVEAEPGWLCLLRALVSEHLLLL